MDVAEQIMIIPAHYGGVDRSFWDRSERLVCYVELICQLPEPIELGLQVDYFCLKSAGYLNYAGLANFSKPSGGEEGLGGAGGSRGNFPERSAEIAAAKLAGRIDSMKIEKICRIITESADNLSRMTEAMILADARNLDDMGAAGIFNEIKRYAFDGRGVSEAIESWQKKLDYGYWQARLKDSFRFEAVRKVAQQRLDAAAFFMNQLKIEAQADDLRELSALAEVS